MTTQKQRLIEQFEAQTASFPKYRGRWNDPEWTLVRIRTRVSSRVGVAFEAGDETLARRAQDGHLTAWAWRIGWDMVIRADNCVPLAFAGMFE